jgi:hypothetical protein
MTKVNEQPGQTKRQAGEFCGGETIGLILTGKNGCMTARIVHDGHAAFV